MLFDSSLRKDLARNFVATVVVILTIVMTIMLIRTLGQASRGSVNPSEVLQVMGFSLASQLTTILALSLFISVIATLSRVYSDSEMAIWLSSGQSIASFVPVLLRFAWPVLLAIALLALLDPDPAVRRDHLMQIRVTGRATLAEQATLRAAAFAVEPEFCHFRLETEGLATEFEAADLDQIDQAGALRLAADQLRARAEDPGRDSTSRRVSAAALNRLYGYLTDDRA
jgi:branched-subunit amino acid transport protein AzlD